MGKTEYKPAIRFKGFTDAWEQRKLGDTFDFLQNNTLSRADLNPETGVAKNVHYGDVLIKFGEYLDASSSTLPYIPTQQIVDKFKGSLLQDGDVIMADTAEDEAVGKCTEIAGLQGFPTISGLHTIPLRPKEKFAPGYLGYYMNSGSYHDQLLPLMQGIKVTSVSKSAILNTDISFPAESDEQAEIGSFFIRLDNLITLHQRKYDKLVNIKKSMLEKMFPRDGATVPEIRFAGFTDAWEQRKLSSLCDKFTDGDWIESKDQSDSGVRLVQTGNVGVAEYLDKPNNKKWISDETFDRLHCEEVLPGDILISRLPEPAGRACIMPFLGTKMITAVDCTIVRTAADVSNKFLVQYLSSQAYFDAVNTCLAGGTRQRISRSNLADFDVPIPGQKAEQEAVGTIFEGLDDLITLHQRKLEKLKNIKKSMLEKMFV